MKYYITLIVLILSSCHKESVVFDSSPHNFELPILLKINGKDCVFDAENKVLKYSILKEELSDFSAFIEYQSESEITFENIKLENNRNNDLGSLEINRVYQLEIRRNDRQEKFKLVFTEIPLIQLVMHDPIVNEPKTLARLTINYPEPPKASESNWIGVEHRGASSLKYDKKSLGFEAYSEMSSDYPRPISFFDFKDNSKWILNALYVDEAKMRNKLSFKIWNKISKRPAGQKIEPKYIELFINNEAYGLYTLSQNYTKEFLDLGDDAQLFKGVESINFTRFLNFPKSEPRSYFWEGWEQVLPNSEETLKWDDFRELHRLISDSKDEEFLNEINQMLDLENVLDYYLFVNLFRGSDSLAKNWFFLKRTAVGKFEILPWDIDVSWGRNAKGEVLDYERIVSNGLYDRLQELNPVGYLERLDERWLELRSTVFTKDYLLELIRENFEELHSYQIIPYENQIWARNLDLEKEQAFMEDWLERRLEVLDEHFGN